MTLRIAASVLAGLTLFASPSLANEQSENRGKSGISGFIGAGVFATPDYEGSDELTVGPLITGRLNYNQFYVQTEGLGLKANVSPFAQVEGGPVISLRGGRDDDIESTAVAGMAEIDNALEAGAFIKIPFRNMATKGDELAFNAKIMADISEVHDGMVLSIGPSYAFAPMEKLRLTTSVTANYADDEYMGTYFGVNSSNVGSSGFSNHTAEAGLKDVGITLVANYALSERWGLLGIAGYSQLMGDAADSPIVDIEGAPGQARLGLGLSYRF